MAWNEIMKARQLSMNWHSLPQKSILISLISICAHLSPHGGFLCCLSSEWKSSEVDFWKCREEFPSLSNYVARSTWNPTNVSRICIWSVSYPPPDTVCCWICSAVYLSLIKTSNGSRLGLISPDLYSPWRSGGIAAKEGGDDAKSNCAAPLRL